MEELKRERLAYDMGPMGGWLVWSMEYGVWSTEYRD
jgi:hypothetical protein